MWDGGVFQPGLFDVDPGDAVPHRLDGLGWPAHDLFPVNRPRCTVGSLVRGDLTASANPLMVAGYSSLDELVGLLSTWEWTDRDGVARLLVGTEPFETARHAFQSSRHSFSREVSDYWHRRGFSVRLSAKVISVIEAVQAGRVEVRFMPGRRAVHAKLYVGDDAATIGSSNFTRSGLQHQLEANARFTRSAEATRYRGVRHVAENYWQVAEDWTEEFVALLEGLLRVVTWREALARACADILDGSWADELLDRSGVGDLWPSQVVGIAQAMWIVDQVGSVLVADATGSGKTKMGAHLVRAVRDRLWLTGRARRDLTVLVCPPAVEPTWQREAVACGLTINTISHGKLSTHHGGADRLERTSLRRAQLLAVDEAHNFLNPGSRRSRSVRDNVADHVLLFTATPISRGASDLLDIVALLGPDNFDDHTHEILTRLSRAGRLRASLQPDEEMALRREIQRFTLRRTKAQLNQLVDENPEGYRHPVTRRICRFPQHVPHAYDTAETTEDQIAADQIRDLAAQLRGVSLVPKDIKVPAPLRSSFTDEQWLNFRTRSAAGLASHHVLAALRSSRAALHEHLLGTAAAMKRHNLAKGFKAADTGDVVDRCRTRADEGPPSISLACEVPEWLTDRELWNEACRADASIYERIVALVDGISPAREQAKAQLLTDRALTHDRVLAFDHHPITLAVMQQLLSDDDVRVLIATGEAGSARKGVQRLFAPDTDAGGTVIALCSDAMNEGLNLQAASCVVHLDLPTTLRVAEQRVGRVDRMDSRHDTIEAWWPRDGKAFATRARERLLRRIEESEALLGSNMPVPDLGQPAADDIVEVGDLWREMEREAADPSDLLTDALEPVRTLVEGPTAVLDAGTYAALRTSTARIMARVAPIASAATWAFLSVRSSVHGAPRWMFIDPAGTKRCVTDLGQIAAQLRYRLADDPDGLPLDDTAADYLEMMLGIAAEHESELLPRRTRRALAQLSTVTRAQIRTARMVGDVDLASRWQAIADLVDPPALEDLADPAALGEAWLDLIGPRLEQYRRRQRRRRYVLIDDLTNLLIDEPIDIDELEYRVVDVPIVPPLPDRVTVGILGVPAD